ncbi:hypothetical protein QTV49_003929 [Vibrio vulnificus]|nr:hypothetical protein [Vibrio vulnificus]
MSITQKVEQPEMATIDRLTSLSLVQKTIFFIGLMAFVGAALTSFLIHQDGDPSMHATNATYVVISLCGILTLGAIVRNLPR